jgi:hypothetical protein
VLRRSLAASRQRFGFCEAAHNPATPGSLRDTAPSDPLALTFTDHGSLLESLMYSRSFRIGLLAAALWASGPGQAQSNLPRVAQENLAYVGAFRLPAGASDETTFNYGGTALAFNPARRSLFITGHDWHQRTAEVSIPELRNTATVEGLATATMLQGFRDPSEGRLAYVNPGDPNSKKVGGHLVHDGKLIVSVYSYYDGAITQVASHFIRPLDLAATGQVQGPVRIGRLYPGFVSGYMAPVPPEWQTILGSPALTGNCCLAIASAQSNGPSISTFDPGRLPAAGPADSTLLVGYPLGQQLGPGETTQNPLYNLSTQIRGVVFPPGTRSVLFIGRHGTGPYCYGSGTECRDPADSSKGTHAYPYRYQVWAYDANDLVAVRRGRLAAHRVQPYAVWNFSLPREDSGQHLIGGAAYDPATRLLYVSQQCAYGDCAPLVHAFELRVGTPDRQPVSPANVRFQ